MITIKENIKPNLKVCECQCDEPLHEKLDKYDVTSFLNQHSACCFIGRPKSGKTTLIESLFKEKELLYRCYDEIFLFMPEESLRSMKKSCLNNIPESNKYTELTYDNLNETYEIMMDYEPKKKGNNNFCIIMDDMGSYMKNNDVAQMIKMLVQKRRHLHLSLFFLVQNYKSIERSVRLLFTDMFVFKVCKQELEDIFREHVTNNIKYAEDISNIVYDKKYNWLFINIDSKRMFKMWDEIILEDE